MSNGLRKENVMSNDKDAIDRLFKLQAKINMMVVDGTRDATTVADALQSILVEKREYLRHLKTVTLAPTKGDATLAKAKDVFTDWLDSDFKNWGTDFPGEDTAETKVDVHEMARDGTYKTLFESLGDPRKLRLTQGQIKEFCRSNSDFLAEESYGTFFLFEVKGKLFVADVDVEGGELRAGVNSLGNDSVWGAGYRHLLVVQQQTA
jgi:hypothetical protein